MLRSVQLQVLLVLSIGFLPIQFLAPLDAQQISPPTGDRLALIDYSETPRLNPPSASSTSQPLAASKSEPLAASSLTMPTDVIPPFAAHPDFETPADISFEENVPQRASHLDVPSLPIDKTCQQLANLVSKNLNSDIDDQAKRELVEMALKMVACNVALKAEAKITLLEAKHTLERNELYSQMATLRASSSVPQQLQQILTPVHQSLERNFLQAATLNQAWRQLASSVFSLEQTYAQNTEEAQSKINTVPIEQRIAHLESQLSQLKSQPGYPLPFQPIRSASWEQRLPVVEETDQQAMPLRPLHNRARKLR